MLSTGEAHQVQLTDRSTSHGEGNIETQLREEIKQLKLHCNMRTKF